MILFEFDDYKDLKNEVPANFNLNDFKNHLTSIWKNRKAFDDYDDISTREDFLPSEKNNQAFLNFDGTKIQARNYVGFIKYNDFQLNIYPKIFKKNLEPSKDECNFYLNNVSSMSKKLLQ